jgi:integrase
MDLKRNRYQNGSLTIEKRKRGPRIWVYRWREPGPNHTQIRRKIVVGTTDEFKTHAAAKKAVDGLRLEVNVEGPIVTARTLTVRELVAHFQETELCVGSTRKSPSTRKVYADFLKRYVLPHWGERALRDVRPVAVERWLESLSLAPATRAKIRSLMSALFQHAMRQEWVANNPIRSVRVSAKRMKEPDVLTAQEIRALLPELPEPCRTMALVAALTGLRVSEILGLQWHDVDLENAVIHLRRGVVDQAVSELKTIGSRRPLPIPPILVEAFAKWKQETSYREPAHWVFASPHTDGKQPYWAGILLRRHVQPAAARVGIAKQIGWHTFRRSYATLLYASEQDVKTTQELMRHSTPVVTLGIYAQGVTEAKRRAQDRLAALVMQQQPIEAA